MGIGAWIERRMLGAPWEDVDEGYAQVITKSTTSKPAKYMGGAKLGLVVHVDGREPFKYEWKGTAPHDRFPHGGGTVPVRVSRGEPVKVQVAWDKILTAEQKFKQMEV
jgi:hypothetical protein